MLRRVVLDAMGVIFRARDDVEELLIPFVAQHGGVADAPLVRSAYREASLGTLEADDFWSGVRMDPAMEDQYLALHELMPGVAEFIARVAALRYPLWCLSNDVSRWSTKLRRRHDLERRFAGFVISADIGARKPDSAAYRALLDRLRCAPGDVLFGDDREAASGATRPHARRD